MKGAQKLGTDWHFAPQGSFKPIQFILCWLRLDHEDWSSLSGPSLKSSLAGPATTAEGDFVAARMRSILTHQSLPQQSMKRTGKPHINNKIQCVIFCLQNMRICFWIKLMVFSLQAKEFINKINITSCKTVIWSRPVCPLMPAFLVLFSHKMISNY